MKSMGKSWQCIDLQVKYGISRGRPEGSKRNLKCVFWFVFHYFYSHQGSYDCLQSLAVLPWERVLLAS